MANAYIGPQADINKALAKARASATPVEDDLRVFSGILVAIAASALLWTVVAILAYAAYRLF
jgi:hypothetical protein